MIFELQGELIIDESKPTILFIDKGKQDEYTHIYGPARVVKEKLKSQYNIIEMGAGCNLTNNYYKIQREIPKTLYRKADHENHYDENVATLNSWYTESLKDLPVIDYVILGTDDFFRLPLRGYVSTKQSKFLNNMQNEFFDYIGNDEEILKIIDETNQKVINKWTAYVSPYAFSTIDYNIFNCAIQHVHETNRLKHNVIGFSIDPAIYTPFFEKNNIPAKFFYFAEDKRGTRNFEQLDISQLQHIVFDNRFKPCTLDDWVEPEKIDQTHNMFFAGTIFQEKGSRTQIWNEFLKDVKSDDCSYFIPLRKNGINKDRGGKASRYENILKEHQDFVDLYDSVKNHKHFKGSLLPDELNKVTAQYKYGMVFRCVSINDSLNFRPVLYTYMNIVPFLDYQYDPDCLQIPKHIQGKLVVRSAEDIDERIKFFNDNHDERINVLQELRKLFRIDDWENDTDRMICDQVQKIVPEFKL